MNSSSSVVVVARGQQLAGLLLSTVPVAERMLLYHAAMTAWIMLSGRSLTGKSLLACCVRLGLR
jgi:hypothetical protein